MIARMLTIQFQPDKVAELTKITRDTYAPLFEWLPGCHGGRWLVDEATGKVVQITLWASEEAIRGMVESAEREAIDRQQVFPLLAAQPDPTYENLTLIARARDVSEMASATSSAAEAVVRRYIEEVNNGGNLALVDMLVAPDYVWHGGPGSREELRRFLAWQRATAPDWHITIHDAVAAGDMVTVRAMASGTRTEESPGVPLPAPRSQELAWIALYRLNQGRIAEVWTGISR